MRPRPPTGPSCCGACPGPRWAPRRARRRPPPRAPPARRKRRTRPGALRQTSEEASASVSVALKGARSCCSAAPGARSDARFAGADRSRGNASHPGCRKLDGRAAYPRAPPRTGPECGHFTGPWYRSRAMGGPQSTGAQAPAEPSDPSRLPEASVAPPPLLDGIVRVKVPPDKIQPFLAKTALFKGAAKEVIVKVASLVQGLECADGSEIVTAGTVNDGLGILFSGKAQVLLPTEGGDLLPVEEIIPGDLFGEVGALLGKPSPYFVISSDSSRVLWLPATILQGMISSVPAVGEALAKRLGERVVIFAAVEKPGTPELMTDIEEQLLEAVDASPDEQPQPPAPPAPDTSGIIPYAELREFDLSPSVLAMVPTKLIRGFRLLPVKLAGNVLTVAMVNPRDNAALAELRRTLQTVQVVPIAIGLEDFNSSLVRLKLLAGLDITERRLPQDGRIGMSAGKRDIDLRVSTLPANRGEKIVMRILEAAGSTRALEQIFYDPAVLGATRKALNRPYGGIIIAGPTGSGKTSSLYALLNERKVTRPDTNIVMVEDPIEYRLPGVTQVQVNAGIGLGFAQVLRSVLRQDPDVIVVGEMRDDDTAQIALEAAMTGHLLLTSLHANNALATIQRLENLGTGRALIAQSIHLVLVQRLVRKLCSACRKLDEATPALLESLIARKIVDKGQQVLPRAVGCDACGGSGYVGRAAVV